jgi:TPR repeat protein
MKKIFVILLLCVSTTCFSEKISFKNEICNELVEKAKQGSLKAHEDLAFFYFHLDYDVDGAYWAKRGADIGCAKCMYMIGLSYLHAIGVKENFLDGCVWMLKAERKGEIRAKEYLDLWIRNDKQFRFYSPELKEKLFKSAQRVFEKENG